MPTLGSGQPSPVSGIPIADIRSATVTDECDLVDMTTRADAEGGFRAYKAGFSTTTIEVETTASIALGAVYGDYEVTNVSESQPLDDIVTYTVTLKPKAT